VSAKTRMTWKSWPLVIVWAALALLGLTLRGRLGGNWLVLLQFAISVVLALGAISPAASRRSRWTGCLVLIAATILFLFVVFERVRFG